MDIYENLRLNKMIFYIYIEKMAKYRKNGGPQRNKNLLLKYILLLNQFYNNMTVMR